MMIFGMIRPHSKNKINPLRLCALAVQKIVAPADLSASGGWYRGG